MKWHRCAKIAFVGSHGIRKATACLSFATTMQRAGRSTELSREVVRYSPRSINENASAQDQLWVMVSQIQQELELAPKAEVLVADRGVMDNFAYYWRACGDHDDFDLLPLVRNWSKTYDLVVRILPDMPIQPDFEVTSTDESFRADIEKILDLWLPQLIEPPQLITLPASVVDAYNDWWSIAERLARIVGEPLVEAGSREAQNANLEFYPG